jgi:hypothetical protein
MDTLFLRSVILSVLIAATFEAQAQQVSGVVTAFKDYPLNRVKVRSIKNEITVLTDSAGRYSISATPGENILFSAEGFFERKIKAPRDGVMNINLKYKNEDNSFEEAVKNNHISAQALRDALKSFRAGGQKDYSKYQNIFELIRSEISNVRVSGTKVYNVKAISFSMSSEVVYVVNDMVVSDISYISPADVGSIAFLEDNSAAAYGIRGANGVIRITLKTR